MRHTKPSPTRQGAARNINPVPFNNGLCKFHLHFHSSPLYSTIYSNNKVKGQIRTGRHSYQTSSKELQTKNTCTLQPPFPNMYHTSNAEAHAILTNFRPNRIPNSFSNKNIPDNFPIPLTLYPSIKDKTCQTPREQRPKLLRRFDIQKKQTRRSVVFGY